MELKTLSVAIAATLSSTAAFAMSEPVAQVTEKVEHHQHEHGVETAQLSMHRLNCYHSYRNRPYVRGLPNRLKRQAWFVT